MGVVRGHVITLNCVIHPLLCLVPSFIVRNEEPVLKRLECIAFELCTISFAAVLTIAFEQRGVRIAVVCCVVHFVCVLPGLLFARDPVLHLHLLLYLCLCAEALLVDLLSLFWGQSELHSC